MPHPQPREARCPTCNGTGTVRLPERCCYCSLPVDVTRPGGIASRNYPDHYCHDVCEQRYDQDPEYRQEVERQRSSSPQMMPGDLQRQGKPAGPYGS